MEKIFLEEECDNILSIVNNLDWKIYNLDFEYLYVEISEKWVNDILINFLQNKKDISVSSTIKNRVIKLSINDKLPTHTFNYNNIEGPYTDTTFTIVTFLNNDFDGGEFYFNNENLLIKKGYGIIHDRVTKQKISKITSGECYMLISHFYDIIPNKLI